MGNINWGRAILGGVVAAIILFIVDWVVNGVILASQWSAAMTALGKPEMTASGGLLVLVAIIDLLIGLTALWIYTGIRPRYGASVQTAIMAGLATWVLAAVVGNLGFAVSGLLPAGILWTTAIVGFFAIPIATLAGAYLYKE